MKLLRSLIIVLSIFFFALYFFQTTKIKSIHKFKCITIGYIIPSDGDLEDECYINLAKKFNDPTWCQNVHREVNCLAGFAVFKKNPNLCFTFGLGDRGIQSCVESIAYWDAAGKKLCNKLTKKESREYCTSESSRYHFIKGGYEYR